MNRREMIAGMVALPAAQSGMIQNTGQVNLGILEAPAPKSHEERAKQYAICQERGHVAGISAVTTTLVYCPDGCGPHPPFDICKYCGTSFRFVTTMEEENKP